MLKYLEGKFGDALEDVSQAMLALAKSLPPDQMAEKAYTLYEKFRPGFLPARKDGGHPDSRNSRSYSKMPMNF